PLADLLDRGLEASVARRDAAGAYKGDTHGRCSLPQLPSGRWLVLVIVLRRHPHEVVVDRDAHRGVTHARAQQGRDTGVPGTLQGTRTVGHLPAPRVRLLSPGPHLDPHRRRRGPHDLHRLTHDRARTIGERQRHHIRDPRLSTRGVGPHDPPHQTTIRLELELEAVLPRVTDPTTKQGRTTRTRRTLVPHRRHRRHQVDPRSPRQTTTRDSRSEEHTSELQSRENLVCRLLLEKRNETTLTA